MHRILRHLINITGIHFKEIIFYKYVNVILFIYFSELFCELSPTASIVGAMVAQTAMNTIMKKPLDDQNVFFYDHIEHKGEFYLF